MKISIAALGLFIFAAPGLRADNGAPTATTDLQSPDAMPIARKVEEIQMDNVVKERIKAQAAQQNEHQQASTASDRKKDSPIVDVWKDLQKSVDVDIQ